MALAGRCLALALIGLLGAPGCFATKSESKALRTDVDALETKVEQDLGTKVAQLQQVLDEATSLLKRNSADLGADVEVIAEEIRVLRGLIASAKTVADDIAAESAKARAESDARLASLEARITLLEAKNAPPPPAEDLWQQAKVAFEAKKYSDAREAYRRLISAYPDHDRADDAQYFRGQAFFAESQWDPAIREYQRVFEKYPKSDLADDALFRAGEAAEKLKNCAEARTYFALLKSKYPSSPMVKKAADREKALAGSLKDPSKCNP